MLTTIADYAPDESKPAGDTTSCDPPNSIDIDGGCQPSCGSLGGPATLP
ncbi:MAG TPA: hypothetical protein VGM44_19560 [Polyangiaceae bacterium]